MRLRQSTIVVTFDGQEAGRLERVVTDPATRAVTHLVVRRTQPPHATCVVPVRLIADLRVDRLRLRREAGGLAGLPCFEERHYVRADGSESPPAYEPLRAAPAYHWYPPPDDCRAGPGPYRGLSGGRPAPQAGARVRARDGREVGRVAELLGATERGPHPGATHLVLSDGGWRHRRKLIPAHWVCAATADEVRLAVGGEVVDRLDDFPG